MKIVILNGNPKADNKNFDEYLNKLSSILKGQGNETLILKLRNMNINNCIGCYDCWLKTPGVCIFKDDGPKILTEYINADFVLFTSPIIMGFMSSLLKKVQERTHPLSLPFLHIKEDRIQHVPRYEKYPNLGVILEKSNNDDASVEVLKKVFKSGKGRKFVFVKTMDSNIEEVAYEINNN